METSPEDNHLNVLFLPFFVTSHIMPLVDTARLFAARSRGTVHVTIVTTPANARLFQDSVDRDNTAAASKSPITIHNLKFPASEVGLPEGIENFASADSQEIIEKLGVAIELLRQPMEQLIRDLSPDCIVSDMFYPWTVDIAKELCIPRLMLLATNCFFHSAYRSLKLYAPYRNVESDSESFVVPGLPDKISMKRSEVDDHLKRRTSYGDLFDKIKESETQSYGLVFTTYYELEPAYVEHYSKAVGTKCWLIGLPSHFLNRDEKSSTATHDSSIMSWLENQKNESVLYVCFGSMVRFSDHQLREIALALEASACNFIWVVRNKKEKTEAWLPEGYEERLQRSNKGLIIREWAPQVAILEHPATGGFMTHCGWNSCLEAFAAGVPLITFPLFAEQFYNEKLITRVLKVGVEVGSEVANLDFEIKSPVIGEEKIVKAISYLMSGSDEAEEIRRQAKTVSLMMKKSQEEGGSSLTSLDSLIEDIKKRKHEKLELVSEDV